MGVSRGARNDYGDRGGNQRIEISTAAAPEIIFAGAARKNHSLLYLLKGRRYLVFLEVENRVGIVCHCPFLSFPHTTK